MIQLNIGVPGSGKSYYVVKQIVDIANSKSPKYKKIITNINGLKYDDLNKINTNVKFEVLHYDDLYEQMEQEYNFHIENKRLENYDDTVKNLGILSNFYDSLVVIDECHTLIDDNDVVKRFITYHRHWNIDLILITQAKSDLPKILLKNVEFMIIAQNGKKRIIPFLFRYSHYASTSEYASNLYHRESVFLRQKYYKYYSSGATVLSSTAILKLFIPPLLAGFVLYFLFQSFHFGSSKKDNNVTSSNSVTTVIRPSEINNTISSNQMTNSKLFLTVFNCYANGVCKVKNNTFIFNRNSIITLFQNYKCKFIFQQQSFGKSDFIANCPTSELNQIIGALNDTKILKNTDYNSTLHSFR